MLLLNMLTPSFVQTQTVHGVTLSVVPSLMSFPFTKQLSPLSTHLVISSDGKLKQSTLGFLFILIESKINVLIVWLRNITAPYTYKNESGKSITFLWISSIESELSQMILAKVSFLIWFNCASVKRTNGSEVSCQKRSHFFNLSNCIPATQPKVGPTDPPCIGYSDKPPVNKSISSTLLLNYLEKIKQFFNSIYLKLINWW